MKPSIETQGLFYSNLGKLFYAIAAADNTITNEEVNTLKQIVNTEWLLLDGEKNKSEIDAMRQLKITFEQLRSEKQDIKICMSDFKLFKQNNEDLYTDSVKQLIWKTANQIASSFARKNKSELVLIAELAALLNKK